VNVIEVVFKARNVYYITQDHKIYKFLSNSEENRVAKDCAGITIKDSKLYVHSQYLFDVELTTDNILREILHG
jgi:hypothetical protein